MDFSFSFQPIAHEGLLGLSQLECSLVFPWRQNAKDNQTEEVSCNPNIEYTFECFTSILNKRTQDSFRPTVIFFSSMQSCHASMHAMICQYGVHVPNLNTQTHIRVIKFSLAFWQGIQTTVFSEHLFMMPESQKRIKTYIRDNSTKSTKTEKYFPTVQVLKRYARC